MSSPDRGMPPKADWYPDPTTANQERWWNGQEWTHYVRTPASTGMPDPAAAGAALRAAYPGSSGDGEPDSIVQMEVAHALDREPLPSPEPPSRGRIVAQWLGAIVAFSLILAGVILRLITSITTLPATIALIAAGLVLLFVVWMSLDLRTIRRLENAAAPGWLMFILSPRQYLLDRLFGSRSSAVIGSAWVILALMLVLGAVFAGIRIAGNAAQSPVTLSAVAVSAVETHLEQLSAQAGARVDYTCGKPFIVYKLAILSIAPSSRPRAVAAPSSSRSATMSPTPPPSPNQPSPVRRVRSSAAPREW